MLVVFVRRAGEESAEAVHPTELAALRDASVSATKDGAFVALARAPETPVLRERIARAFETPSVVRFRRARPWLLLALFPVLALIDLERQLISLGTTGVAARFVADLVLFAFLVFEIARPIPRHPRTWALASLAVAARYAYMIAAMCGRGIPLFFLGLALSIASAALAFVTMPTAHALARDVRAALRVEPLDARERTPAPVAPAVLAALALPAILIAARALGAGALATAALFVGVGAALPLAVRVRASPPPRAISIFERADASLFGFAAAITLVRLVHYATLACAESLRCAAPRVYDSLAKPLVETQSIESHETSSRYAMALAAFAVLVVPVVEERLYRATLQRALATRTTATRAIAASAMIFGIAHVGVYRASIHQAILLGVAFGAAYEEAGLAAAILAHALYNAAQLF